MIDGKSVSFPKEKTVVVQLYLRGGCTPHPDCESRAPWHGKRRRYLKTKVIPDVSQIDSTCSLGKGVMIGAVVYPTRRDGSSSANFPKRALLVISLT